MSNDYLLVASYYSPHFFFLILVHKKVWCSLSSLSIQTGLLAMTFYIILMYIEILGFGASKCYNLFFLALLKNFKLN